MYRLSSKGKLKSGSDNIVMWQGVVELYNETSEEWEVASGIDSSLSILQWPTDGYEKVPTSEQQVNDVLHGEDGRVSPPLIVKMNASGIDELKLGKSALVELVNSDHRVENFSNIAGAWYDSADDQFVLDLSNTEGWIMLYLTAYRSQSASLAPDNSEITIPDVRRICGIRRSDDQFTRDWDEIAYSGKKTEIRFSGISENVEIITDEANLLEMDVDEGNTQATIPSEFPAKGVDKDGKLVPLYPRLDDGETMFSIGGLGTEGVLLLLPDWIYGQLMRSQVPVRAVGEGGEEQEQPSASLNRIRTQTIKADFVVRTFEELKMAVEKASPGDRIQVAATRIEFTESLNIEKPLTIFGAGEASEFTPADADSFPLLNIQDTDSVVLETLNIKEGSYSGRTSPLVNLVNVYDGIIWHCILEAEHGPAIEEVKGQSNVIIDNVLKY